MNSDGQRQSVGASQSSGDLLADRRWAYAEACSAEGDHVAAAELLMQVVERVPCWPAGWLALGLAEEKCGHPSKAILAFDRAAASDEQDRLGASLHASRLLGTQLHTMPPAFVTALFDHYAPRFESHLVDALHYRGPDIIVAALHEAAPDDRFTAALDLGCGTGLMARALSERAASIDGVDLSSRMVDQARASGLYRSLAVGDLGQFLDDVTPDTYDLVVAADVFVYIGALDSIFRGVARTIRMGGIFAFTVQTVGGDGYGLGTDMRFSHARSYVEETLATSGLAVLNATARSTRRDAGVDVAGLVVVAVKR